MRGGVRANTAYWAPKLERNVARDRAANEALQRSGWVVVRIWEHEEPAQAVARILLALNGDQ
jgi:DNA mismatch endonuclease (patch repair protein)